MRKFFLWLRCRLIGHNAIPFAHTGYLDTKLGLHVQLTDIYQCTRCKEKAEVEAEHKITFTGFKSFNVVGLLTGETI